MIDQGTTRMTRRIASTIVASAALTSVLWAQAPATGNEDVAKRQLESGRSFARQGNYTEALKDFRAVADTHASTSVADNALLEIARYYLDVINDTKQATTAVEAILTKYPTSDSAPDAYVMAGRLALSRGHQPVDLEAAIANFDRVFRLFPNSDAVPRSLLYAGETHWYARRYDDALASFGRVTADYPTSASAADSYLGAGRVLVSLGRPVLAMEELQQIRNRWPNSPAAAIALSRITLLNRLFVRGRSQAAFTLTTETLGPPKLQNVVALAATTSGGIYLATEMGITPLSAPAGAKAPASARPRGLALDSGGNLVGIESNGVRSASGEAVAFSAPQSSGGTKPLVKIDAAAQMSNGDWLIMDDDEKGLQRFSRTGTYVNVFNATKTPRLAVNAIDDVAVIDRDGKTITIFDATGKVVGRIPFKGASYDLPNPEDLAFDSFGHLYVLDRAAIAVFSPYPVPAATGATPPATPAPASGPRTVNYSLVTQFTAPEKDPAAFRKATAFAVDPSGAVFLYDERAQRVMVYR